MKLIHLIIHGILLSFSIYYYYVVSTNSDIHLDKEENDFFVFISLIYFTILWTSLGRIIEFRNMYNEEKEKNTKLLEKKNLIKNININVN